jgi:hypothetical protein
MKPERELRLAALLPSQSALMPGAERGSRPVLAREVDASVTIIKDLGKVVLEQEQHRNALREKEAVQTIEQDTEAEPKEHQPPTAEAGPAQDSSKDSSSDSSKDDI